MSDPSPFSTPKRKRADKLGEYALSAHPTFSFELPAPPPGDGSGSPRTKVAHRFRGLALDGGGGVAAGESAPESATAMEVDDDDVKRKRARLSPAPAPKPTEIPETPDRVAIASPAPSDQDRLKTIDGATGDATVTSTGPTPAPGPSRSVTSLNVTSPTKSPKAHLVIERPFEPKPQSRKRAATPPPIAIAPPAPDCELGGVEDAEIVEPIRAALTWHDDEITIYDPEDADDDGTGINGIGFKPTPAIAYARTVKRKQQLAEYKKREEREARARRSQRRRGSPTQPVLDRQESSRKVRFMEGESSQALTT